MLADMSIRTINGIEELKSLVGEHLGYSAVRGRHPRAGQHFC
jgi:hypothetical protein